jgi:predicted Zn-dependent peptidase
MMFRGTDKYPDGKFDELSARMGANQQNATTYFYRTNYYESVPVNHLEEIMEMESDRMNHLNFTSESFEKEKGAVVGELRRHLDNPAAMASDELFRQVFQVEPYRYTVLGTEAEIKGFTIDEANYFYRTFYAPNNATLIVIGDVEEAPLMKLVEKYYGDMKPQEIPRETMPAEPGQKAERRADLTHPQATSELVLIGYPIPAVETPDAIPLTLLASHLSRGTEAVLQKLLVNTGIAVSADASPGNQPNVFEFSVQMAEGHPATEAVAIIDKELAKLKTKAIPKDSFERALNQELLNVYGDITDNSQLGSWLGEYLMLCDNYMRGFQIIDGYKAISPADITRVVKTYFKPENRSIVFMRPEKKGKS